jgi:hypothetical protein
VRTAVSPGRARPSGPKLSVLFRRSYVLSFNHVLVDMVVSGLSQNPHLEITNLALSWTQSWCAVRANPHLQPARMRGQSFHVGVRHCNHAPSLMSGPAICQSFIISVVGRSGEMELGWRSRSAGEGWAGSSCRRDSQRFSPLGSYQSSG